MRWEKEKLKRNKIEKIRMKRWREKKDRMKKEMLIDRLWKVLKISLGKNEERIERIKSKEIDRNVKLDGKRGIELLERKINIKDKWWK